MNIVKARYYQGRNIYCHRPVFYLELDLGEYGQKESREFHDFNDKLVALLPNIAKHTCGIGEKNGFQKRLVEGTFFGHIVEHISLEILSLLNYKVRYGKTRMIEQPSHYFVIFECPNEEMGIQVSNLSLKITKTLLENSEIDFEKQIEKLKLLKNKLELGPSTMAIYQAAKKRKIPVKRFDENGSILQLGTGRYLKLVEATITSQTSCVGVDIACDKTLTKKTLDKNGISVPIGKIAKSEEDALKIAQEIGTPVVVKPCDGNQGKGVTLNLKTENEIRSAFKLAENYSKNILVEKHIIGKHYRILVVDNEVIAASERIPAHVIGDGSKTIKQLIETENNNPLRGEDHDKPLTKIKVDPVVFMVLARQNLTMNYVPNKGQKVFLRENANISTGGIALDVTDQIHKDNVVMAKRIARLVGLDIAGIDLVTDDISKPTAISSGAVIEVNAAPGIRMHLYPSKGKQRQVGEKIVNYLFKPGCKYEIPIISITGTNGKTTTARLTSHVLQKSGLVVGSTSTDGIYIDDTKIMEGDNTGPISAQVVLDDPSVEVAVLETARGGIVKRGLGYDLADIAVVTNLGSDHVGQDGINNMEDLFYVKSLVVEAVKKDGFLVLNAEDEHVVEMSKKNPKAKVVYFSKNLNNKVVKRHLALGGKAIFIKDDTIFYGEGEEIAPIIPIGQIPITFKGKALHNLENCMASIATLIVSGVKKNIIIKGMQDFDGNKHNPGRANIFQEQDITVILDYGHNKEGYKQTLELAKTMKKRKMILVLGAPGDRMNNQLKDLGKISSHYGDYYIIKEDDDLRERKINEVATLIKEGLEESGVPLEKVELINKEQEAITKAIQIAEKDDLVVVFYENFLESRAAILYSLNSLKQKNKKIV